MRLSLIVAVSEDNAIGQGNQLLWHIPSELKFFRETTTGHPIIMGRKTWESIGRPLPKRTNIVITRQVGFQPDGVYTSASFDGALRIAKAHENNEVFVIGGGEIYRLALPLADRIYLTRIHGKYPQADTFFPPLDHHIWTSTKKSACGADGETPGYTIFQLERKNSRC